MKTKYNSTLSAAAAAGVPCGPNPDEIGLTPMKTKKTSRIANLTVALLFGTALTVAAIDFKPPDTSGIEKQMENAQKQLDKINSAPPAKFTATPQVVQIPEGQDKGSTTLGWSAIGYSTVQIKVKVNNETVKTAAKELLTNGSLTLPVRPGTSVFTLIGLGRQLASVTVKAERSSSSSSEDAPEPPSTNRATITANPKVVTIPPGQTTGTTTLTWDAGKDHPYAEVWVKVGDNDETQIVEQGKGSRRVNVRPGETYLYILTDAGQRLSTVSVTTK